MAPNRKIYALKRIRLTGRDREAAAGFIDEITLLQRLRGHSNIIQLIDAEVGPLTAAVKLGADCFSSHGVFLREPHIMLCLTLPQQACPSYINDPDLHIYCIRCLQ